MKNAADFQEQSFFAREHLESLYFSTEGRLNRLRYWSALLLLVPVMISWFGFSIILVGVGSWPAELGAVLFIVGYILILVFAIVLLIKRAHDRNHSGWYLLLMMVPIWGLVVQIDLYFYGGTYYKNKYSEDPRELQRNMVSLFEED